MRNFYLFIVLSAAGLACCMLSSCRSEKSGSSGGRFMEHDPGRSAETEQNYFARERERKRQYEREFKDVRRPMNQDHFQVFPLQGKYYTPRSEQLHDASREADHSLF